MVTGSQWIDKTAKQSASFFWVSQKKVFGTETCFFGTPDTLGINNRGHCMTMEKPDEKKKIEKKEK